MLVRSSFATMPPNKSLIALVRWKSPWVYRRSGLRLSDSARQHIVRRLMNMPTTVVYVALLDERVDCWRPVTAEALGDSQYRFTGSVPEEKVWESQTRRDCGVSRPYFPEWGQESSGVQTRRRQPRAASGSLAIAADPQPRSATINDLPFVH